MKNSIRIELTEHLIDIIEDQLLYEFGEFEYLHFKSFEKDSYVIGKNEAEKWLEKHDITAFEIISDIIAYQNKISNKTTLKPSEIYAEKMVNMYIYIVGEKVLESFNLESENLLEDLKSSIIIPDELINSEMSLEEVQAVIKEHGNVFDTITLEEAQKEYNKGNMSRDDLEQIKLNRNNISHVSQQL